MISLESNVRSSKLFLWQANLPGQRSWKSSNTLMKTAGNMRPALQGPLGRLFTSVTLHPAKLRLWKNDALVSHCCGRRRSFLSVTQLRPLEWQNDTATILRRRISKFLNFFTSRLCFRNFFCILFSAIPNFCTRTPITSPGLHWHPLIFSDFSFAEEHLEIFFLTPSFWTQTHLWPILHGDWYLGLRHWISRSSCLVNLFFFRKIWGHWRLNLSVKSKT